jgi:hypothetical protein
MEEENIILLIEEINNFKKKKGRKTELNLILFS